ncbi:T9SS type A sorting domain-containing protein [Polaribacter septentrionalilitoris]|uniref:T9SS type A sorting domain-containing protein n=1 Tax=Polaribacter septentrionalilitoris TaxID=2494657 RepID=UPI001357A9C9|nr:T9SS type A sorting domain-containing protein [Polaribacter septentrionalilitoris]
MINNTFKSILLIVFALSFFSTIAQDAPPSGDVFRLQNVATGKYLTDAGASASAVTMSDSGEQPNTHFRFVQSGNFYNIDSETLGILRAPGAGGPGGAYVVVSTTKASPASDTDKTWTIYHNSANDTYRFGSRISGRFMYHEENGTVTHAVASDTDDRSNWKLIPYVQTPVEIAPDEDTSTDLTCPSSGEFQNDNTRNVDLQNSVNVGTADDRSCYSDYSESNVNGKTWGVYNITDGSNHWDGTRLQPRIERSLPRAGETGVGTYVRFKGVFRILEVGDGGSFSQNGSYLAQAKGKHSGGGGSNDPAILLYRAHPVYGDGINAGKQVAFDIYAERILERGGEGSGREVVFLKRVNKNEEVDFQMEVGFRQDPNDATKKIHYCDAIIGGEAFNYNIPSPERGLESGIRYGAYRVKGGRAQFRWANTTYEKVEVKDTGDTFTPSDDVFRLRNVATGQFLTDAGTSATAVTMTDSGEATNTHWTFVKSGSFFNIDSESFGIIRALGTGGVVSTSKAAPAPDTDKIWTIHETGTENIYRIEARNNGKFLYHEEDGSVTNIVAIENDTRSHWETIPTSQSLSVDDNALNVTSLRVYPNPAKDVFTISLSNMPKADIIIYNTLGKTVYRGITLNGNLEINNNSQFAPGLYMVKAVTNDDKIYHTKLIIQ